MKLIVFIFPPWGNFTMLCSLVGGDDGRTWLLLRLVSNWDPSYRACTLKLHFECQALTILQKHHERRDTSNPAGAWHQLHLGMIFKSSTRSMPGGPLSRALQYKLLQIHAGMHLLRTRGNNRDVLMTVLQQQSFSITLVSWICLNTLQIQFWP